MPSYISSAFLFAALACGASAAVLKAKDTPPSYYVTVGGCTSVGVFVTDLPLRIPVSSVDVCWETYCGASYVAGFFIDVDQATQLAITSFQQNSSAPCLNLTTAPPQLKAAAKKP